MGRNFENLKGTYDYLPEKQIIREKIKSVLQGIFVKYGFSPVETPILCMYDLLASKYSEGADILNEMYKLSDQGRRKLGLRYDLTITFSKLISSNKGITLPFKRYEIGKVFRDGPVKVGRNREFTQCDVDVVGVKSVLAEAEYMTMTSEAYKELGLDIEIEFNNRKLLSGIIFSIFGDISEEILRKSIMLVDKFAKLTDEELFTEFAAIGIDADRVETLKNVLNSDYTTLKKLLSVYDNELIAEGLEEIDALYDYLSGTEAEKCMKFAPYLARGIDIYTGTVWEIFLKDRKVGGQDFNMSIGGGGRYDKIITTFIDDGNEYPAVGMSFGLDVIYEILVLKNSDKKLSTVDLFVIPMGTETQTFKFATKMRELGIKTEMEKRPQKLKKSMNYANKMNIPYVIIIGEDEIKRQKIQIKDMDTGKNQEFSIYDYEKIVRFIKDNNKN